MSSLNILLICRDAKPKDAKVRIPLNLCFLIREYQRQTKHFKKMNHLLQVWIREELELFQEAEENFEKIGDFSSFCL